MNFRKHYKRYSGFTLAELLIGLMILAEIAAFAIPKVLQAQRNTAWNAEAKEIAGMISTGYQRLKIEGNVSIDTKASHVLMAGNLNYVKKKTSGLLDVYVGAGSMDCSNSSAYDCYEMHNGGVLVVMNNISFTNQNANQAIPFAFDADGVYGGSTTGNSKAVYFFLYYNGRLTDSASRANPTCVDTWGCSGPHPSPPWFSWN